jgi:CRP-like cAMP-binding protein
MDDSLSGLFRGGAKHRAHKGQILVSPDEQPSGVYYLQTGYVKTYDITAQGDKRFIALTRRDEIFPLYWALDGDQIFFFYESMCDIEFSILPRKLYRELVEADSELMTAQLNEVLLAFRTLQQRLKNLGLSTSREKLAYHLLFLGERWGTTVEAGLMIDPPITYQDLSDSLNVTRETINRVIREFMKQGIVCKLDKKLVIQNVGALSAMVNIDNLASL